MFRWRKEKGGIQTYYRLYILDRHTYCCVRPGGRDGGWVGGFENTDSSLVVRDRYLGQVKSTIEMLFECYYAFMAAREHWNKELSKPLRSRQRTGDRLGWACNHYREIEEELDSILGEELVAQINQGFDMDRYSEDPFQVVNRMLEKFKTVFGGE